MAISGKTRTTPDNVHLWGGALCLDFANSVDWTDADEPLDPATTDALTEPGELARWGARVGVGGRGRPDAGELAAARALRDDLHGVFPAVVGGTPRPGAALERVVRGYAEAVAAGRL